MQHLLEISHVTRGLYWISQLEQWGHVEYWIGACDIRDGATLQYVLYL